MNIYLNLIFSRCWSGRADGCLVADCSIYDRGAPADPDEIDKKDKNNKRKLLEQERIAREQTKNSKRKS